MLLVGLCHLTANVHVCCMPSYFLPWPIMGVATSLCVFLAFLTPHVGIPVSDRFLPLAHSKDRTSVFLIKLYKSFNQFSLCVFYGSLSFYRPCLSKVVLSLLSPHAPSHILFYPWFLCISLFHLEFTLLLLLDLVIPT